MTPDWPIGWRGVVGDEREGLAREILRELLPGHLLYGRNFTVMARRDDQDDVLIQLEEGEVAEMHLTRAVESNPSFPGAIQYVDVNAWREAQY